MSTTVSRLTVKAPAKLNLHLAVKDRRPDGFHNIESIFLAIDFGDILHFQPIPGRKTTEIVMEGLNFTLPMEKNIIFKALSLFREKTAFFEGLKIRVEKRIPPGGGLGGGSSDAASTLLALNRFAGFPLSRGSLLEMAASLGSDVPFFIYETGAALVSGRGECIEPVEAPRCFFVLVNPGFPSDTAAAFRLLDKHRSQSPLTEAHRTFGSRHEDKIKESQILSVPPCLCEINFGMNFRNDFLPVFEDPERSLYNEIISTLMELGADFAALSGAGSTCFGVFKERDIAEKAAAALRGAGKWSFVEFACIYNLEKDQ
jgi:4-diphosphocytidyl-2-C-methyl-D-erythritol kinase